MFVLVAEVGEGLHGLGEDVVAGPEDAWGAEVRVGRVCLVVG